MNQTVTDYVRERLIGAAETELRLPSDGLRPAGVKGYWPEIGRSFVDLVGWGAVPDGAYKARVVLDCAIDVDHPDHDQDDPRKWIVKRRTPLDDYRGEVMADMLIGGATAREVTEYEEVLGWVVQHVRRPEDRSAVWAFAHSQADIRRRQEGQKEKRFTFLGWCRSNGMHKKTAQRRFERAIDQIAVALGNVSVSLVIDGQKRVSPFRPENGIQIVTLDEPRPTASRSHWRAPDAVPTGNNEPNHVALAEAKERSRLRRKAMGIWSDADERRVAAEGA